MELSESNYFDPGSDRHWMSASQVKRFLQCEAQAQAELYGITKREETTALLVGSCVDAHFSGTMNDFLASHKQQVYTRTGGFRAEFQQAMDIITLLENDDLLHRMLQGETQKIVTGEIAGIPFKGKLDSLLSSTQCEVIADSYPEMAETLLMAEGAIVDLKVMRDMAPVWTKGAGRQSFVAAWHYDLQLAIYQKLLGQKLPCFLVVATKEKNPDKALIHVPQYMLDAALDAVEPHLSRFQAIKAGLTEPTMCGECAWCRREKMVTGPVDADELEGATI